MFNLISLQDTHEAYNQNSYIQRLTIVTILYLPVSLTTVRKCPLRDYQARSDKE